MYLFSIGFVVLMAAPRRRSNFAGARKKTLRWTRSLPLSLGFVHADARAKDFRTISTFVGGSRYPSVAIILKKTRFRFDLCCVKYRFLVVNDSMIQRIRVRNFLFIFTPLLLWLLYIYSVGYIIYENLSGFLKINNVAVISMLR